MRALLAEGINRPRKGADAGDHPPITPMRAATETELGINPHLHYTYIITMLWQVEQIYCTGINTVYCRQ